ncbi:MAG: 50S ribosomal protein L3 [Candidatus Diapherotrites archaeon]|uniref:50S ribosomal protein L3 n=1 Tax=Candidatus Iainarchaeum sp. TaxID=3101447 RepID=A0A8T4LGP7_9ARCH|nr:50S ribosomal protein L3 [Candidatus Diapherotrites archaeon]
MVDKSRPRTGSLQYYPRSRADKETPSFRAFSAPKAGKAKAVNFFGYKAGMVQIGGKDLRKSTPSTGHDIIMAGTVIECPPLRVIGIRVTGWNDGRTGINVLTEMWADKADRHLQKKIYNFKSPQSKKKKTKTVYKTISDLEKIKDQIANVRLLVATQPSLTGFGKKKPDVSEVAISGGVDEQLAFAKEKLGNELHLKEVFENNTLMDVKAVSTGKGMQGVIKRHNVKIQRHKAKKQRAVGSIGPWHPPTVMWTVARAGQMGYNSRTEFNKKILVLGEKGKAISPSSGFAHYGNVSNDFVLVAGSIPGPSKRCIGLRLPTRPSRENRIKLEEISFISTVTHGKAATEETPKAAKVEAQKVEKKEHKSVEDELKQAAK